MRFIPKKFNIPKADSNGQTKAEEVVQESKKKLQDTIKTRKEIEKVSARTTNLTDRFAEALEQAMRRSHG